MTESSRLSRLNLFEVAEANCDSLQRRFGAAKAERAGSESQSLQCFADRVARDGRVAVNVRPHTLANLLKGERLLNTYELVERQAICAAKPVLDLLKERLGKYYTQRIAFDSTFEDGERFRYGALNIGGPGAVDFGLFCCVLGSGFPASDSRLAYLMHDSLSEYVSPDGIVDVQSIGAQVASQASCHYLATIKHAGVIPITPEGNWDHLLCSSEDYVEAIFVQDVTLQKIAEVRVSANEYRRVKDIAFASFGGESSDGQSAFARDFLKVLQASDQGTLRLRRV